MKTTLLVIVMIFTSCLLLHAQTPVDEGWAEVGNSAYNAELHSICFTTQNIGFAVGNEGSYLKTTDGGLNWTAYATGFSYYFDKITFTDALTGYMIGNDNLNGSDGHLLKTTDGGLNWQEIYSLSYALYDIQFFNDTLGFMSCYERVLKTTDAGVSWTPSLLTNAYDVYSVFFRTADTGFIAANGKFMSSTDGGLNWTEIMLGSWNQVYFTSDKIGYLVKNAGNTVYRTLDGGTTWNTTSSSQMNRVSGICFQNDSIGIAWNNNSPYGQLSQTNDSSANWTQTVDNPVYTLYDVSLRPDGRYFGVGKGGLIIMSDTGINWTQVHRGPIPGDLKKICFVNDSTGYAVGDLGIIVKTSDRGANWVMLNSGTIENLTGICSLTANDLWVSGQNGTLLKSSDGGINWISSANGYSSSNHIYSEIQFLSQDTGFVTSNGVYKTVNGGANWNSMLSSSQIYGFSAPTKDTMYACGQDGVMRSIDQGNNWSTIFSSSSTFYSVDFINSTHGLAAYNYNRVYMTTDAGDNWTDDYVAGNTFLNVKMVDDSIFYASAQNGLLRKTEDAGANWFTVASHTTRNLNDICFTSDGWGYIVGRDGFVLRKANIPTYTLEFDIVDENAVALSNVILSLNATIYPAGTDSVGGLIGDTYNYILSMPGYLSDSGAVILISDSVIHVVLHKFHQVQFHAENIFGHPVDGAQISFSNAGTQISNISGDVVFPEIITSSSLAWSITAGSYLPQSGLVDINCDTLFTLILIADLDAPLALAATNVGDLEFTANWNNVAAADSFQLFVSTDNFITHLPGYNGLFVQGIFEMISGLTAGSNYQYRLKAVNSFGESSYSNVINVSTTTGILENADENISIYPNPASTEVMIEMSGINASQVSMSTMIGSDIIVNIMQISKDHIRLNTESLEAGIYLIRVKTSNEIMLKKIVINN